MAEYKTNFALLLDILDISTPEMMRLMGADRTLMSRWRSGNRRILPTHHWMDTLIEVVFAEQRREKRPLVEALLREAYPMGDLDEETMKRQLRIWLSLPDQNTPIERENRDRIYRQLKPSTAKGAEGAEKFALTAHPEFGVPFKMVEGHAEARMAVTALVDYMATIDTPKELYFVCPDGVEIFTRDEGYSEDILERVIKMAEVGHRILIILRTEFKMSDVAAFAGPWLVAHLKGFIQSWYYDDFRRIETDRIFLGVEDLAAITVSGEDYVCRTYMDHSVVNRIIKRAREYQARSVQRFRYRFFEEPRDYLAEVGNYHTGPAYLFERMPHFAVGGEKLIARCGLTDSEGYFKQFAPLFTSPDEMDDSPVYHLFSMQDIEDALDKPIHLIPPMTAMAGRRVYMKTQLLVDQLLEIQRLLSVKPNYHVSFVESEVFDRIALEIGVWGKTVAIGWLGSQRSTATVDYTNTAALHGFCATVWSRIPALMKGKSAARRSLNKLINRAEKMGYQVK